MPDSPNKSGILTRVPPTIRASAYWIEAKPHTFQAVLLLTVSNVFMGFVWLRT